MPTDLQQESEKLKSLVGSKRNATTTQAVEAALASKWEGIQSAALRVLGSWGDTYSIARLREFLDDTEELQFGWSIRGVAVTELSRCVGPGDAEWVLDRYFSLKGVLAKHEFLRVVLSLPPEAARERLIAKTDAEDRDDRQATMKALGNMAYPDRKALLEPFLTDRDPEIREGARYLYGRT